MHAGANAVSFVLTTIARSEMSSGGALPQLVQLATQLTYFAALYAAAVWLRRTWTALPPEERKVGEGPVTPNWALNALIIPIYNYYWMFVMNLALCENYESLAPRRLGTTQERSRRGVVLTAGCLQIVGTVGALGARTPLRGLAYASFGAAVFWFMYMRHVDGLREQLEAPSK